MILFGGILAGGLLFVAYSLDVDGRDDSIETEVKRNDPPPCNGNGGSGGILPKPPCVVAPRWESARCKSEITLENTVAVGQTPRRYRIGLIERQQLHDA